nr:transketolase C-terminal domain-containing protein [Kosmotoga sp. DU53]
MRRLDHKIRLHADEIVKYDEYMVDDAEILVIAYGSVARSAIRAVRIAREDKINVGLFKPITIWPFPTTRLRQLLKKVSAVIIAEMNLGQIVYEVSRVNRRTNTQIELLSKVNGELISPQEILDVIAKVKSSILDL